MSQGTLKGVVLSTAALLLAIAGCTAKQDALQRILESGKMRIGMDASFPPFEYVDAEGNLVGFDVDLAREIAAYLGVQPDFVANLPYDGLYDALTAEQVDVVISALYVDPSRRADFAYSTPYFNAGQVLVTEAEREDIDSLADMEGRTLAVEFGGPGDVVARMWAKRLRGLTVLPLSSPAEALAAVAERRADAALVDHVSALAWTSAGLRIAGDPVTDEPYAVAVRAEDRALLQAVNEVLAELKANGTLDRLYAAWFIEGSSPATEGE